MGDSITQGQVSANYVARLARSWKPRGVTVVNAGVNGDLAYNVAVRLDDVIRQDPRVVTLLVGTNDVNSQFDEAWTARYRKNQMLPVDPTRDWYGEQVDIILGRVQAETQAKLAVLDIPPLGEDLDSRMNGLVREYNQTLRTVAASHSVPILPLYDQLTALIPAGNSAPPYRGDFRTVVTAAARHMLLRQSWDRVSRSYGLTVLTDHIHLNDRAADVVASLIDEYVTAALVG